jgi:hypothetical protein
MARLGEIRWMPKEGGTYRFRSMSVPCVDTLLDLEETIDDTTKDADFIVGVKSVDLAFGLCKTNLVIDRVLIFPTRSGKGCWVMRGVLASQRVGYWEPVTDATQDAPTAGTKGVT